MIAKLDVVFLSGMGTMFAGGVIFHEIGFIVMGVGALVSVTALVKRGDNGDDDGEM